MKDKIVFHIRFARKYVCGEFTFKQKMPYCIPFVRQLYRFCTLDSTEIDTLPCNLLHMLTISFSGVSRQIATKFAHFIKFILIDLC